MKQLFRYRLSTVILGLMLGCSGLLAQNTGSDAPARRIGLFVGANQGGPGRAPLMWAVRDSQRMGELMKELGGMDAQDLHILSDPGTGEFRKALSSLGKVLGTDKSGARRTEFMFYYSGHSDESGLLLRDGGVPYQEIRDGLRKIDADISIAILDSCSSGSFTRTKGGSRIKPFLYDDSINMKGYAFITSSSADEAAQESDRLGASFFTHYMISGLRGAADRNSDGRVNLNEAYEFAFQETLASTGNSTNGPQHPSYDIQLKGSGDLVLSDLSQPSASLILTADLDGRLFIRDESNALVLELGKQPGKALILALQPGTYSVRLETDKASLESRMVLNSHKALSLGPKDFRETTRIANRSRGNETQDTQASPEPESSRNPEDKLDRAMELTAEAAKDFTDNLTDGVLDEVRKRFKQHKQDQSSSKDSTEQSSLPQSSPGIGDEKALQIPAPEQTMDRGLFNLSFVPGLSIAPTDREHGYLVNLGVLFSQAGESRLLMAAGIGSIVFGSATGVQTAGIYNSADSIFGIQSAGIFNTVNTTAVGLQAGGIWNSAETIRGVQSAGIFNTAGTVEGVQAAGLFNTARGSVDGLQAAGLFNTSGESAAGIQAAGLFNASQDFSGLQASGLFNTARKAQGVQSAGLFNVSQELDGIQAAGLFNYTKSGKGVQTALINTGESFDGLPIGLFNIYTKGIHDLSYWYSLQDRHWIGLDSGSNTFYSGIYGGYHAGTPLEELQGLSLGVNTGFRLHSDAFFFDANLNLERYAQGNTAEERLVNLFTEKTLNLVPGIRVLAGFDLDWLLLSIGCDIKGLLPVISDPYEYLAQDPSEYAGIGWTNQVFGGTVMGYVKFLPLVKVSLSL